MAAPTARTRRLGASPIAALPVASLATTETTLSNPTSSRCTHAPSMAGGALRTVAGEPQSSPQPGVNQCLFSAARPLLVSRFVTGHLHRTARYGPVRRVVWEGGAVRLLPIPIHPFMGG